MNLKKWMAPLMAIVVLVSGAVAILSYLSEDPVAQSLVISEVSGDVSVAGREGSSATVGVGALLEPDQRLITGPASRAVLSLGEDTRIRLGSDSTVQVRGHDSTAVTLELEDGALQATVRPGSSALRVGSRGRQILATDATCDLGVGPDGTLVVEMSEGSAVTSGFEGMNGPLAQGSRTTVSPDGQASVTPISEELLLAVQWPTERRTKEKVTQVTGTTVPGAQVNIYAGERLIQVIADHHGIFQASLPLEEGENPLRVEATDPLGREATVSGWTVELDHQGPTFRGGVDYEKGAAPL